ncbi:MAG TPA: IPT/TIG domain-containing protein [Jatrophihabitans sp.]
MSVIRVMAVVGAAALAIGAVTPLAAAATSSRPAPSVASMDVTAGITAGGSLISIVGANFTHVKAVYFGGTKARSVQVRSSSVLLVSSPPHAAGRVYLQVVTTAGRSARTATGRFSYEPLSLTATHLNGGMTAAQAIALSARYQARAAVRSEGARALGVTKWTSAVGAAVVSRAKSWLGLPYSWAGGTQSGPSLGQCDWGHGGGGWFDCRLWGFDCSGLVLYSVAPYRGLVHYAATQYTQAGAFHPSLDELRPGDLVFFSHDHTVAGIHHVAIYIGDGKVIQAPQSGFKVSTAQLVDVLPTQYYGATRPLSTGKQAPSPIVSRLSGTTSSPDGAGRITITGRNFSPGSVVLFGSTHATEVIVHSSTTLVVRVPKHAAGEVPLRVVNAWGISAASEASFTYASPQTTPTPTAPAPVA